MFGLGPTELIVILVIALVLLGPKKLPDVASGLGKAIRQFRKATTDLTNQLDIDDDVKAPFRELKAALRDEPAPYVPPAPAAVIAPDAPIAPIVGTVAAGSAVAGIKHVEPVAATATTPVATDPAKPAMPGGTEPLKKT